MINTNNIPKAYSEVYEFINVLGDEYKNKIPEKIYSKIKNNRDKAYVPQYTIDQSNVEFSNEALALIASLNLQYWCKEHQEKERLKRVYHQNAKKEEEKYSYENMFRNNKIETEDVEEQTDNVQMIEYKEENILTKLISKIKKFLFKFRRS